MTRSHYREHGESPQPARVGGLAAVLGRRPAVLASSAFLERAGPFQSHPNGGLDGVVERGADDFDSMEVTQ
ncbi:hypothetical protein CP557_09075 [Natrinema ejinorense]|uniref:Uncharacterized protein n=1 Tax=Natrinema ejinorense TaxID=373386 RepID=A0A2A5QUZ2_9EURY|nr:hypothetical protein CP557_09075 [Natrinema ejinorense]